MRLCVVHFTICVSSEPCRNLFYSIWPPNSLVIQSKYSGVITLHINFVLLQLRITELVVLVRCCQHGQEGFKSFNERFEVGLCSLALLKFDKNPSKKFWFKHRLIR